MFSIIVGVIAILMIVIVVTLFVIVFIKPELLNKLFSKENKVEFSENKNTEFTEVGNTDDFVPVMGFDNDIMQIGNKTYRMVIECSSINYDLLSSIEQRTHEILYNRFLNSLNFPIAIYIQARELDEKIRNEQSELKIKKAEKRFPQIKNYAEQFVQAINTEQRLYAQTTKIKRKYVIVMYNEYELKDMKELTDDEINQFIKEELHSRCSIVAGGLADCGLNVRILDKSEITEVLYAYYKRDMYMCARDIAFGKYETAFIKGHKESIINDRQVLDSILEAAKNNITTKLIKDSSTADELAFYKYLCDCLNCFKQNDISKTVVENMIDSYDTAEKNGVSKVFDEYIENHLDEIQDVDNGDLIKTEVRDFPEYTN